jgi:hypothetical protein
MCIPSQAGTCKNTAGGGFPAVLFRHGLTVQDQKPWRAMQRSQRQVWRPKR